MKMVVGYRFAIKKVASRTRLLIGTLGIVLLAGCATGLVPTPKIHGKPTTGT